MRIYISLLATAILASVASASTPVDAKNTGIIQQNQGRAVSRPVCAENDNACKELEQQKKFYREMRQKLWGQLSDLTEMLDHACGWNRFDVSEIESKQNGWEIAMAGIEENFKGRLAGPFNSDPQIIALRARFEAIKTAVQVRQSIKGDPRPGVEAIATIFEMTPKVNSFYYLGNDVVRQSPENKSRIASIESDLQALNKDVQDNQGIPEKLRKFYTSQAGKVEEQLKELKTKAGVV